PAGVWETAGAPGGGVGWPVRGKAEGSAVIPPAIAAAEASQRPATMSKKAKKVARREKGRRDPSSREALWWREVRADPWGVGYGGGGWGFWGGGKPPRWLFLHNGWGCRPFVPPSRFP